jgi:hypothetical protein
MKSATIHAPHLVGRHNYKAFGGPSTRATARTACGMFLNPKHYNVLQDDGYSERATVTCKTCLKSRWWPWSRDA